MSSIVIQGDTSGSITVEAPSVAGTHTLTLPKATGNIATDATVGLGMKNRIINGRMVIDQRNGGASVTATNGGYTLDRWYTASTLSSKFTVDQDTDAPTGFSHSVKLTSSAATTPSSTDQYFYAQNIEGFNWADISYGTANAKTVTLSFWVKSSLTGTFGGSIQNSGYNYSYPFSYSISSANTWEQKSVTITGATAGTWIGATNGVGARLYFSLGNGSTYLGTANTWAASQYNSVTGETQVIGTSGATLYLTGVQLEVGENATPFEYRMYGTELALCQRYYEKSYNDGIAVGTATTGSTQGTQGAQGQTTTGAVGSYINFTVQKRATPTIVTYDSAGNSGKVDRVEFGTATVSNFTSNVYEAGDKGFIAYSASGAKAAHSVRTHYTAESEL